MAIVSRPLTLSLSPEYRGEGTKQKYIKVWFPRPIRRAHATPIRVVWSSAADGERVRVRGDSQAITKYYANKLDDVHEHEAPIKWNVHQDQPYSNSHSVWERTQKGDTK